jgi:hypothetical protein
MLLLFEMGIYLATGAAKRREKRLAAAQDAKP